MGLWQLPNPQLAIHHHISLQQPHSILTYILVATETLELSIVVALAHLTSCSSCSISQQLQWSRKPLPLAKVISRATIFLLSWPAKSRHTTAAEVEPAWLLIIPAAILLWGLPSCLLFGSYCIPLSCVGSLCSLRCFKHLILGCSWTQKQNMDTCYHAVGIVPPQVYCLGVLIPSKCSRYMFW